MNKVLSLLGCLLLALIINADVYGKEKKSLFVCGFESMDEVNSIFNLHNVKAEIVTENVTEGKGALKITTSRENKAFRFWKLTAFCSLSKEEKDAFTSKEWGGEYTEKSVFGKMTGDWSPYKTLKIDIFNPSDETAKIDVFVLDDKSGGSSRERHEGLIKIKPGANQVQWDISSLLASNKRNLDMKKIKCLWFAWESPAGKILFFDNFRLEADE